MRPNFYFSQSIDERQWSVWRPVVKLGEHQGTFFFYVDSADADKRELIRPSRGLYGKEFLELDHRDVFQLMEFQQKWGPITGLRAQPNKTYARGTTPGVALNKSYYGPGPSNIFRPVGITRTLFLYDGYGEADILARERYGAENLTLRKVVHANWDMAPEERDPKVNVVPCHVATIDEVSEAVCDAQVVLRAIAGALRDGYTEEDWESERRLVLESVKYCNAALTGTVAPLDVVEEGNRTGVCTLMQYLFINLVKGVMLNNAYRYCQNPACRRLFTPKEYGRRADSKYCSEECQVRAKYLRGFKNGKGDPHPIGSPTSSAELEELELAWSTSNMPVRTLRRDQLSLLDGSRAPVPGDPAYQLPLLYSFGGISPKAPMTEELLRRLERRDAGMSPEDEGSY